MSNENRNHNCRGTIGNDPDESTTEAYPNIAKSLSGPNPNIADQNQSMNLVVMGDTVSIIWSIDTFEPILRYFVSILSYPIFDSIDTVSLYH